MLSNSDVERIAKIANTLFDSCNIYDANAKSHIIAALIRNQGMEAVSDIGPAINEMNRIMEGMADKVSF